MWPECVCILISQGATLHGADFLALPVPDTLWEAVVASVRGWRQGLLGSLKRVSSPTSFLTLSWRWAQSPELHCPKMITLHTKAWHPICSYICLLSVPSWFPQALQAGAGKANPHWHHSIMCVCKYVCICMCAWVYVCTCVHVCVSVCMNVYCVHVHICMCVGACVYVCVHMCTRVCQCVHECVYICACAYMYVCVCVWMYACVCVNIGLSNHLF